MRLDLLPTLAELQRIYAMPRDMARFHEYLRTLTGGSGDVVLPIVAANPMGKDDAKRLTDALVAIDAEGAAREAMREAERRLAKVEGDAKVAVCPVDNVGGLWSDRDTTDDASIFDNAPTVKRGFAVALVYATETPTRELVRERVLAAVYRLAHARAHGVPRTLRERLVQEGRALRFAGAKLPPPSDRARRVLAPLLEARDNPTLFAACFGDEAAERLGHKPLGVEGRAAFALALTLAHEQGDPVAALVD